MRTDIQCPPLYGFAILLLALASFMSRLSLNGTKMAAKQHQTHFLPIQQSPTERLLPIPNDPSKQPRLKARAKLKWCVPYENRLIHPRLRSEGVGSEKGLAAKGSKVPCALPVEEDRGQARQIKHRCPLRLANRHCAKEQHLFSLLSWA